MAELGQSPDLPDKSRTGSESWHCPAFYLLPKEVHFVSSCVKRLARGTRSKQESPGLAGEMVTVNPERGALLSSWGGQSLCTGNPAHTSCLSLSLDLRPYGDSTEAPQSHRQAQSSHHAVVQLVPQLRVWPPHTQAGLFPETRGDSQYSDGSGK